MLLSDNFLYYYLTQIFMLLSDTNFYCIIWHKFLCYYL